MVGGGQMDNSNAYWERICMGYIANNFTDSKDAEEQH